MIEVKLKPCPFCGNKAKLSSFLGGPAVFCTACPAAMVPTSTEVKIAVMLWNNRDTAEFMKHYRQGLADAETMRRGELMQAFDPD